MAAAMARSLIQAVPDLREKLFVDSAGTTACEGDLASPKAIAAMSTRGIDLTNHRAKKASAPILRRAQWILCMASDHKDYVQHEAPECRDRVFLVSEFAKPELGTGPEERSADIPDPFGCDQKTYDQVAQRLEDLLPAVLARVRREVQEWE